jgi:hypothetical protein
MGMVMMQRVNMVCDLYEMFHCAGFPHYSMYDKELYTLVQVVNK